MEKITEKLLLEKASPKTNKLEQIKTLNLSKLGLKHQDLPVKLLSGLRSLERLDLSRNRLQEFPRNLELPALRHLDFSDNQMEDVTSLEALSDLEELKMEDNLYITVSDNYKLMVLLPNLRMYNGKDISTTANHLRYVYSDNLRTRIVAVWDKSFRLPDPVTAEKLSALEKDFVSAARQQVKFGPNSVTDFTKWKVEIIAKEYLRSLVEPETELETKPKTEPETESETEPETKPEMEPESRTSRRIKDKFETSSPAKRKRTETDADVRMSPLKKRCPDPPGPPVVDSPRKASLRLGSRTALTPKKEEEKNKKDVSASRLKTETLPIIKNNSKPVHLKPLHVLQCHSKQDSSEDFSTQLWACAFQPLPDSTGGCRGSRLVATCGGDSVCVIDCETGMVMKKYKVSGEEFFSLAWSTVLMSRGGRASAQHCSILAAGGKRGLVKLMHPRNNVAYGEFRASRKALSALRFNHQQGNFLYTGSYDNKILLWDIGGVDSQYNYKVVQLLQCDTSATPLHLCLPPASPKTHLLAACDDGLICFNTQLGTNGATKSRSQEMEITFPIYEKEDKDNDYHTVDGLSFLSDDIVASKNVTHGSIYLWSWSRTKAQRPDKKKGTVSAVLLAELQWVNTEIPYLALNTCPGQVYVMCGDDKGRVWTYHVSDLQKNGLQNGKPIQPTEVLEWPTTMRKGQGQVEGPSINSVAMDPELHYLVALSDKNMVIVWKREETRS